MVHACKTPHCPNDAGPSGLCADCARTAKRGQAAARQQRGDVDPFYKSALWRRVRARKLAQAPLCEACAAGGVQTIATEVDHIKPIAEGGDRTASTNLQSLCKSCHSRKTARENTGAMFRAKVETEIILVCGPPCGGKITYVREHMAYGDLVIDIDQLVSALSGRPVYDKPVGVLTVALDLRTKFIDAAVGLVPKVWVIASGATSDARRHALGSHEAKQVIVLRPPRQEALARALSAREDYPAWERLIEQWYREQDLDNRDGLSKP